MTRHSILCSFLHNCIMSNQLLGLKDRSAIGAEKGVGCEEGISSFLLRKWSRMGV